MFAGYASGLNMSNSKSFNPSCMATQLHGFSILLEIHSVPQGIRRFRVAFGAAFAGFSSTWLDRPCNKETSKDIDIQRGFRFPKMGIRQKMDDLKRYPPHFFWNLHIILVFFNIWIDLGSHLCLRAVAWVWYLREITRNRRSYSPFPRKSWNTHLIHVPRKWL